VEDLVFWLDADRLSSHQGRVQEVSEFGPFGLRAAVDAQPPFCIPMFNLRSVLLFPTTKATERVQSNRGLLRFVLAEKKRCDSLAESFSGFALLNPICRSRTQRDKQRMVSLRLRSDDGKTEFILEWDGADRALTATLRTSEHSQSVTTAANTHPNKQWRVIYFQWQKGSEGRLSITVDGISSETQLAQRLNPNGSHSHPKWTIELGGSETDPATLFYGAIAEIILFTRPLRPNEQLAIISYLKQKFHW